MPVDDPTARNPGGNPIIDIDVAGFFDTPDFAFNAVRLEVTDQTGH